MRKKIVIIGILFIVFFVLVNIFYGFFYEDNVGNLLDKITFRIKYYSREILKYNLDYNKNKNAIISKDNLSVELYDTNYDSSSGQLTINFKFYLNNEKNLERLRFMLRVHDDKKIYYNNSVGDQLFVGNTDYLLYNKNLYSKLSTKGFDTSKLNEETTFRFSSLEHGKYKTLSLTFNLGENNEISNNFYVEFLDIIYTPKYDNSYKVFDYLGEFRYKISL